jgi:hypothetical protein
MFITFSIAILLMILLAVICFEINAFLKRKRCAHNSYRENMKGSAVCNDCSKNLGSIGNLKNKRAL